MAVSGSFSRCVVVVGLITLSLCLPHGVVSADDEPPLSLNLRVKSTQPLSPGSLAALIAETNTIWNGHIRLRWRTDGGPDDTQMLRVFLLARAVPPAGDDAPLALGELVRAEGAAPFAIASVTGARRIVESSAGLDALEPPVLRDHRLGVVLGRAVAHEIGHYLLQTGTHASQGLMRARIDAREFADFRNASFRLDAAAQAHLARLAASGTSEAFSYAR